MKVKTRMSKAIEVHESKYNVIMLKVHRILFFNYIILQIKSKEMMVLKRFMFFFKSGK